MHGTLFGNRIMLCTAALLFPCVAPAQPQSSQPDPSRSGDIAATVKNVSAPETADAPTLTEEQKLAFQTLETSEAASRGFEAPMRSYGLLQIGSTFATLDTNKARALLRDAFTASLEIHDDDTRTGMQWDIFRALVPLSPPDAQELLPQAEGRVHNLAGTLILGSYAEKRQFDKGLELLNQIASVDEFPYGGGSLLMDAMPPEMAAEKQALFTQAVASYKNHKHPDTLIGGSTLTGMIGRFGLTMPPKLVLEAIGEILSQARAKADQEVRLAGSGGSARFASDYQYQLFALLPTLRKLDENRAKQLLDENQDLQTTMQQFPEGMKSLMPPSAPNGGKTAVNNTAAKPATATNLRDYLRQDARTKIEAITQESESDPVQAIAHSMTLPLQLDDKSSPRAIALEGIARANMKKNPGGAESALADLRKVAADLPPLPQTLYLSSAADIYLQMDDKDKAASVVSEGFKVADKLLEKDSNPDSPNEALKAWWPSANAYRRFVDVDTRISDRATVAALKEIKDPEIRTVESIIFARTLLGLSPNQFMVAEKRGKSQQMYTDTR